MWHTDESLCQSYEESAELIAQRIRTLRPMMADSGVLQRVTLLQSEYNDLAATILVLRKRAVENR